MATDIKAPKPVTRRMFRITANTEFFTFFLYSDGFVFHSHGSDDTLYCSKYGLSDRYIKYSAKFARNNVTRSIRVNPKAYIMYRLS